MTLVEFNESVRHVGECWIWKYGAPGRYGSVNRNGITIAMHRWSWSHFNGREAPVEMHVLHTCDHPKCVNPDHLFLGTQADNNRDMWAKGRGMYHKMRGSKHWKAKLSEDDIRKMRRLWDVRTTQKTLSRDFGVSQAVVSRIVLRQSWTHVKDSNQ